MGAGIVGGCDGDDQANVHVAVAVKVHVNDHVYVNAEGRILSGLPRHASA